MAQLWLDTSEYPFKSHEFKVNGQKLHYIDEGHGDILLFVHGTPSWSFDFRHIIKALRSSFRCIAIDHIGFGLSDKPEHYDYSTINHSRTLEKFIIHKQLNNLTMVLHDFGMPIGFNFSLNHPGKVKNFVILNSWLWSAKQDPDFIKLSRILRSPVLPFLYRYMNFSARFILPGSFGERKLSKKLLKQYTQPFGSKSQRNGTLAFAKSLLNDQDWFEELWVKKHLVAEKPFLFIWGMKDPVIKPKNLEKFLIGFPQSEVLKINSAGHFPQEEEPLLVSKSILEFLVKNKNPTVTKGFE